MHGVVVQAALVLILSQELSRRCPKRSIRSYSVEIRLAIRMDELGEELFGFGWIARASTLANSLSSNAFVDMPDPTALDETSHFAWSSHGNLVLVTASGRLLRRL